MPHPWLAWLCNTKYTTKKEKKMLSKESTYNLQLLLCLLCICYFIGLLYPISMKCNLFCWRKIECDFLHQRKNFWRTRWHLFIWPNKLHFKFIARCWLALKKVKHSLLALRKIYFFNRTAWSRLFFWSNRSHFTYILCSMTMITISSLSSKISFHLRENWCDDKQQLERDRLSSFVSWIKNFGICPSE